MARFYGNIGFSKTQEAAPGTYIETITEKTYSGSITSSKFSWESGDGLNDDYSINKTISIIADGFARDNYGNARYAIVSGARWKVKRLDYTYPRLTLTLGGVYNGPIPITAP